jgi:hypothetical protein
MYEFDADMRLFAAVASLFADASIASVVVLRRLMKRVFGDSVQH